MRLWNPSSKSLSVFFLARILTCLLAFLPSQTIRSQAEQDSPCTGKITQGIRGRILFFQGNQMPSPGVTRQNRRGVRREIGVFPLTLLTQTSEGHPAGFYKKIGARRIKRGWSGKDGCFAISLPPGRYSLFIREKGQWYANSFGGEGEIFEVVVEKGKVTDVEFPIRYAATY